MQGLYLYIIGMSCSAFSYSCIYSTGLYSCRIRFTRYQLQYLPIKISHIKLSTTVAVTLTLTLTVILYYSKFISHAVLLAMISPTKAGEREPGLFRIIKPCVALPLVNLAVPFPFVRFLPFAFLSFAASGNASEFPKPCDAHIRIAQQFYPMFDASAYRILIAAQRREGIQLKCAHGFL